MPPPTVEIKPVPSAKLIEQLRDGVEKLLAGSTYAEIKIDDLVREAGIAKSTFYVYFEDKGELLRVLTEQVMSDLIGLEGAWWTLPPDMSKSELRASLSAMFEPYRRHGLLLDAITAATVYDPAMGAQFSELMEGVVEQSADFLRRGQKQGVVTSRLDPDHTAYALAWMQERGFNLLLLRSDARALNRRLDALADVIWRTIHGGPGR